MILLASPVLVAIMTSACIATRPAALASPQETHPSMDDAANPAALEEAAKPELSDETLEMVAVIRAALQENDREGARERLREAVAALEDPEPGHEPSHIAFLLELDQLAHELGSLEESRRLCESVLRLRQRSLPADNLDLLMAKANLAVTKYALRDLAGAYALEEEVLAAWARLLPPDHPDLLWLKGGLAVTMRDLGDFSGAHSLFEEILVAQNRLLPPDHPDLLMAKGNLALARRDLGDIAGANALEEEVLAAWTRLLPPDHPDLLKAKVNLASTRKELGDLAGARELEEGALAAWTRLLPTDHPYLLSTKHNLAATKHALGELASACQLEEEVIEAWTRLLPPDHPDLLGAKQNLAATKHALGELASARDLDEEVLTGRTRLLPPDHPELLAAKHNLAATMLDLGELAGARALFEEVLATRTRLLPPDHPELLVSNQALAVTMLELGELVGANTLVSRMLEGIRLRAQRLRCEAVRPAREEARAVLRRLSTALFLSGATDPRGSLDRELFAALESLRLASVSSSEAAHALSEHPELAETAKEIAERRAQLNDLATAGPVEGGSAEDWRNELLRLASMRDRAEHELRSKLAKAGVFVAEVEIGAVGAKLAPNAVAVSYLRYPKRFERNPTTGETPPSLDSLLAFLVRPGGAVCRVELGPAAELEELVRDWRESLGRPLAGRGVDVSEGASGKGALSTPGRRLREQVLDPVLAAAGEIQTLHVVLDDFLHLVPLDALPLESGLVGERVAVRNEVTLARLLREKCPIGASGTLVALGGIDFDSQAKIEEKAEQEREEGEEPEEKPPAALAGASSPPVERWGRPEQFEPLRQTRYEIEDVGTQFEEELGGRPLLLQGAEATKLALWAAAPKARYLHVATHGWFASERFKSQLDSLAEQSARDAFQRAETTLTGFAPETLCGLALAGANRGKDALGRVPGILTAEELASFDLRNCELAVLSACETNVGIRRAGQGIQSLQTALHAAGARTAITSLWKVDDAATRRLFELFYSKLWKEKLGKHDALWQAKMALRAEGHPPRDWAGWVLSGDPD